VSTKFVQIKALGFKWPTLWAYIQVRDFRAIMALLLILLMSEYYLKIRFTVKYEDNYKK
jgi:hypothetical protein